MQMLTLSLPSWRLARGPRRNAPFVCIFNRNVSNVSDQQNPFKILYLGRDEFSCVVLRQLYEAKGSSNSLN